MTRPSSGFKRVSIARDRLSLFALASILVASRINMLIIRSVATIEGGGALVYYHDSARYYATRRLWP